MANTSISTELKVGILGGGQLSRLLAHSGQNMGLQVHVLCENPADPAAQVTGYYHMGSGKNLTDLTKFIQTVDLLTFESEFFDTKLIEQALLVARKPNLQIFPSLKALSQIQDRRSQKDLLAEYQIPTSPFVPVNTLQELEGIWRFFDGPFVLKKAQGGYDGYGTHYINSVADIHAHQAKWQGPYLSEQKVSFLRELALMAFRSLQGEVTFFPLVETVQAQSRCDHVVGPLTHAGLEDLKVKLTQMLNGIDYVGALGVELFETKDGLMVNELAPRVHNTGHYSSDALQFSQFDFHWLAGIGKPFPENLKKTKYFVMSNLIGESVKPFQIPRGIKGKLYWYGKQQNRPGRKMGHINYTGDDKKGLLFLALEERKDFAK